VTTLAALHGLLLRTQISVARLLGIGVLSALAIVIGVFARFDPSAEQAVADAVVGYGLGLLVPLATLWLGTSALGDLVEDRLLAYLWLKPVPRWQLPAAAVLATLTVVVPLTAVPLTVSALVAGAGGVAGATLLAAALAALAYSGLFVAFGLWFRRAVWWGLAFIVVWENFVAYAAEGAARFTVLGWAASVLALGPRGNEQLEAGSGAVGLVVLPAIAVAGWLVATWRYARADVD
jgi:ABC-2 type transport system permease protein